jgi:hypothetical protein
MTTLPTQTAGDKTRQALSELCDLQQQHPEKKRQTLLKQVEKKFDLTPKECEFLERNFQDSNC